MIDSKIKIVEITGEEPRLLTASHRAIHIKRTGMFLCKEGEATVTLDHKQYVIRPGSVIVYFSYSELKVIDRTDNLKGTIISGELEIIQPLLYQVTNFNAIFDIKKNPYREITEESMHYISIYIDLLRREIARFEEEYYDLDDKERFKPFREMSKHKAELIGNCLIMELVECYADAQMDTSPSSRKDEVLQKFISSLYRKYKQEHEVTFYAEEQFLTSRYFSTIIKEKSGRSPSEWIATALLVDAKKQLTSTNDSIKEISENLNFPNQSYFGKWFKNLTGVGPTEFRNGFTKPQKHAEDFDDVLERGLIYANSK